MGVRDMVTQKAGIEPLIKAQAYGLGFDLVGITTLGPAQTADAFDSWLGKGYAGDMTYLPRGADKRRDSRLPYPEATHAIVVALNYDGTTPSGPVARYARGDDYHDVMIEKLNALHAWMEGELCRKISAKPYVDTGPILERDLAQKAGLGWIGKNTNLLNPHLGSFFFIGTLLVDLELTADAPFEADRCGSCTRCLDACPTQAFVAARVLDATRCISYLTIESRSGIPVELRDAIGSLLYGCDICQDVCPYNVKFARELTVEELSPRSSLPSTDAGTLAREILAMSQDSFRAMFRGSPMKRAKRTGLARNAAVVLGNTGEASDLPTLTAALNDEDPIAREHVTWAIEQIRARVNAQESAPAS